MTVKQLKDYKGELYNAMCRDLTEFEKNFLFISTGIVAFSITFIKDIAKAESSNGLLILFSAWILIIGSISLMMYAFLKSAWDSDDLWKVADVYMVTNDMYLDETVLTPDQWKSIKKELNDRLYASKKRLKKIRSAAVILFIIGLISLAVYVGNNLVNENKEFNKKHLSLIIK